MKLNLEPNIANPDDFYEALIDTFRDMTDEESKEMNAMLVLILANHIGDIEVLKDAMRIAKES